MGASNSSLYQDRPGHNGPVLVQQNDVAVPAYARGVCSRKPTRTVVRFGDGTVKSIRTSRVMVVVPEHKVQSVIDDKIPVWAPSCTEVMADLLAEMRRVLREAAQARWTVADRDDVCVPKEDAWHDVVRANIRARRWVALATGTADLPGFTPTTKWEDLVPLVRALRQRTDEAMADAMDFRIQQALGRDDMWLATGVEAEVRHAAELFLRATDQAAWLMG